MELEKNKKLTKIINEVLHKEINQLIRTGPS